MTTLQVGQVRAVQAWSVLSLADGSTVSPSCVENAQRDHHEHERWFHRMIYEDKDGVWFEDGRKGPVAFAFAIVRIQEFPSSRVSRPATPGYWRNGLASLRLRMMASRPIQLSTEPISFTRRLHVRSYGMGMCLLRIA